MEQIGSTAFKAFTPGSSQLGLIGAEGCRGDTEFLFQVHGQRVGCFEA